jgi:WD40 repeat protein
MPSIESSHTISRTKMASKLFFWVLTLWSASFSLVSHGETSLAEPYVVRRLEGHRGTVNSIFIEPSEQLGMYTGDDFGTLFHWDLRSFQKQQILRTELNFDHIAVAVPRSASFVVVSTFFGDLRIIGRLGVSDKLIASAQIERGQIGYLSVALSPDERFGAAILGARQELQVFSTESGKIVRSARIGNESRQWQALSFSADGSRIFAVSSMHIEVFDATTLRSLRSIQISNPGGPFEYRLIGGIDFSSDYKFAAIWTKSFAPDQRVVVINLEAEKPVFVLDPPFPIFAARISEEKSQLGVFGSDGPGRWEIYDLAAQKLVARWELDHVVENGTMELSWELPAPFAFSEDLRWFISPDMEGKIRLWSIPEVL